MRESIYKLLGTNAGHGKKSIRRIFCILDEGGKAAVSNGDKIIVLLTANSVYGY